jgi:hypothetical protein
MGRPAYARKFSVEICAALCQHRHMLGEAKKQFSSTRSAFGNAGAIAARINQAKTRIQLNNSLKSLWVI